MPDRAMSSGKGPADDRGVPTPPLSDGPDASDTDEQALTEVYV